MTQPSICRRRNTAASLASLCFVLATTAFAAAAAPRHASTALADQLHARALHAFQQGRFPEAYGRFVALADAGHARSARQALWMCEHGLAHFERDWDCTPHQVSDWAAAAGVPAPRLPTYEDMAPRQATSRGPRR